MVREIGTAARRELERELGAQGLPRPEVRVREQLARATRACSTGSGID